MGAPKILQNKVPQEFEQEINQKHPLYSPMNRVEAKTDGLFGTKALKAELMPKHAPALEVNATPYKKNVGPQVEGPETTKPLPIAISPDSKTIGITFLLDEKTNDLIQKIKEEQSKGDGKNQEYIIRLSKELLAYQLHQLGVKDNEDVNKFIAQLEVENVKLKQTYGKWSTLILTVVGASASILGGASMLAGFATGQAIYYIGEATGRIESYVRQTHEGERTELQAIIQAGNSKKQAISEHKGQLTNNAQNAIEKIERSRESLSGAKTQVLRGN